MPPGSAFADLAAGLTFRACADDHGRLRPARAAGHRRARGWPGRRTGAPTRHGQRRALRCTPPDLARPAPPIQAATAADEALLPGKRAADRGAPPAPPLVSRSSPAATPWRYLPASPDSPIWQHGLPAPADHPRPARTRRP